MQYDCYVLNQKNISTENSVMFRSNWCLASWTYLYSVFTSRAKAKMITGFQQNGSSIRLTIRADKLISKLGSKRLNSNLSYWFSVSEKRLVPTTRPAETLFSLNRSCKAIFYRGRRTKWYNLYRRGSLIRYKWSINLLSKLKCRKR